MPTQAAPRDTNKYDLLRQGEVQAFFAELTQTRALVFVTGCARSGTSLLQRCLSTLRRPEYYWSENALTEVFTQRRIDGDHIVLKRTSVCHRHFDAIPPAVRLVHIVRHPADVLTSTVRGREGYYVSFERWREEMVAFEALERAHPAANLAVVRYEDLLMAPDEVQRRLGLELGLAFDLPFTRYVERNALDQKIDKFTGELRVWEPIDVSRPGRSRDSNARKIRFDEARGAIGPELERFTARFQYSAP